MKHPLIQKKREKEKKAKGAAAPQKSFHTEAWLRPKEAVSKNQPNKNS